MAKALDWGILEGSVGPRVRLLRNALSARSIAVSAPHGLPTGSLTVLALHWECQVDRRLDPSGDHRRPGRPGEPPRREAGHAKNPEVIEHQAASR